MSDQQKSKFPETGEDLEPIKGLNSSSEDDPRVNISTADDVDIEPDEDEQSDEPAPPIIPPEKIE